PPSIRNGRLRRLLHRVTEKRVERRDVTIEAILQTLGRIDAEEGHAPRGLRGTDAGAAGIPSAEEGERRQLTALFCDLVGSTELSTRLDPEDFRDVVRAYQRIAEEAVGRFGGHVGKYLGDGLLVNFGWPTAHEDDAERAVRAGLALLGASGCCSASAGSAPARARARSSSSRGSRGSGSRAWCRRCRTSSPRRRTRGSNARACPCSRTRPFTPSRRCSGRAPPDAATSRRPSVCRG